MKIEVKSSIYSHEAILNACYAFLDRAFFFLDTTPGKKKSITVSMKPRPGMKSNTLRDEFLNELLHASLRCRISETNKKMREFVVYRALYSSLPPLQQTLVDQNNRNVTHSDPLGIRLAWEKKFKKKNAHLRI
ncbi:MAG TPA: His-Xaa-Ser system protein HxsD [Candidatus Omnitrophota bacterium]|nr:His-Xaa-Ser system protein HxsD [Candidatus Omnitrophota bacterium]